MKATHRLSPLWIGIGCSLIAALALGGCASSQPAPATPSPPPVQASVEVLIAQADLEQAAQVLLTRLAAQPEDAAGQLQLGLVLSILQPEQAGEYLAAAARQDPALAAPATRMQDALRQANSTNDPAYQLTVIGQALSSLEEWALALAALEQAVAENPNYAEAWAYLGEARQHVGWADGLAALQTAVSLDPQSYPANLLLSIYWQRNLQPKRALPYLQEALSQDPHNLPLLENLAQTLVQAGMVETGFETLQELTAADPDQVEAWMMLARLSLDNSLQVDEVGLPAARQAMLLEPENADAVLLLGRAYLLTEDALLAERFLDKAIQQNPQMSAPHLYLAIIYLNQEDKKPAEPHLRDALRLAEAEGNQAVAEQAGQFLRQYFP